MYLGRVSKQKNLNNHSLNKLYKLYSSARPADLFLFIRQACPVGTLWATAMVQNQRACKNTWRVCVLATSDIRCMHADCAKYALLVLQRTLDRVFVNFEYCYADNYVGGCGGGWVCVFRFLCFANFKMISLHNLHQQYISCTHIFILGLPHWAGKLRK